MCCVVLMSEIICWKIEKLIFCVVFIIDVIFLCVSFCVIIINEFLGEIELCSVLCG